MAKGRFFAALWLVASSGRALAHESVRAQRLDARGDRIAARLDRRVIRPARRRGRLAAAV